MKETEYDFPSTVRHVYDIDVFEILDQLRTKLSSNIEALPSHLRDLKFIDDDEEFFVSFMKKEGIDLTENKKYRNYIIPSSNNLYHHYLGWKILSMDAYKIEPLLSYQSVLFLGNDYAPKDNFLGLLEYSTYTFVKGRNYFNEFMRLEKMVDWLERNRVFLLNKAYNNDDPIEADEMNSRDESKVRTVLMNPDFASILVEKLKQYFPEVQHTNLYNLIIKDQFKSKLSFSGNRNQLTELFKRFHYNGKITVRTYDVLATWISANFEVLGENNTIEQLNQDTILAILKNSEKEAPKGKRILEDMAEYIVPKQRRQAKENLTK
ncbi:MAG: hypothetical protein IPP64_13035 [Bacteroidetes bacterium]|nr:hypothetical protein [Bacteroidota bacterium]